MGERYDICKMGEGDYDRGDRKKEAADHSLSQAHRSEGSLHTEVEDQKIDSLKTVHALWPLESPGGHFAACSMKQHKANELMHSIVKAKAFHPHPTPAKIDKMRRRTQFKNREREK